MKFFKKEDLIGKFTKGKQILSIAPVSHTDKDSDVEIKILDVDEREVKININIYQAKGLRDRLSNIFEHIYQLKQESK